MKKFSFLLMGAFLLGTIAFALADESKALEEPTPNTVSLLTGAETTTGAAAEATTGATAETTTGATAEATTGATAEVATGTTAEVTTGTTVEVTTGDTAEVTTGDTAEVATGTTVEVATGTTAEVAEEDTTENTSTPEISDSAKGKYNEEQISAYEWAYEKGITTMNNIDKARLSDGLTRAELAKMMSQYMTKVLGKTPVDVEKANYADVDESLGDLADYIQTAYTYKIMGINADGTPLENFNPNGKVTRAEYATVFSRVLYGDKYNKAEGNYYENHLAALKEAGILSNTTPSIQEIRGWVMLMMYRSNNRNSEISTNEENTEVETGTVAEEPTNEENTEIETGAVAEEPTNEENTEVETGAVATGSTLTVTVTPNI